MIGVGHADLSDWYAIPAGAADVGECRPTAANPRLSTKTDGTVQMFGRVLAIWLFIIAALFPVMGAYVTLAGLCPIGDIIQAMQSG